MRRETPALCEVELCPDSRSWCNEDGERDYDHCATCPKVKLEASYGTDTGRRLQNAQELVAAQNLGLQVSFEALPADEFLALLILKSEQQRLDREAKQDPPDGSPQ